MSPLEPIDPPTVSVVIDATTGGDVGAAVARTVVALTDPVTSAVPSVAVAALDGTAPTVGNAATGLAAKAWHAGATVGAALSAALTAARSDHVLVVTAGLEPTADWLTAVSALLDETPQTSAIAAVLVDPIEGHPWPATTGLAFTGHPLPPAVDPVLRQGGPVLVPGPAWVVRRRDLVAAGGFDATMDSALAAVDAGWRLWLRAGGVVARPEAALAVEEHLAAAAVAVPSWPEAVSAETDALAMIYRNLDEVTLAAALPAALLLSPSRLIARGAPTDRTDAGVAAFTTRLDELVVANQAAQAGRLRPDVEIVPVMGHPLSPDCTDAAFVALHARVLGSLLRGGRFGHRSRILVATADTIAERMAGPAIRAWRLATELARDHEVRLVSTTGVHLRHPDFEVATIGDRHEIDGHVDWADIIVFQGWVMTGLPSLHRTDKIFVVDVYDPMHLEQLEQSRDAGAAGRALAVRDATGVLNEQLLRGDFFLCASDKQRDLWLGHLASLGRINPATYDADPGLDNLVAVVPFGVSDDPPVRNGPGIRGVFPGIGADDPVILWGGGVYNWFDPLTLVRAVDRLRERRPDVRLVFLGMRHPNADVPEMSMATRTRQLADELGLTGVNVFFNEEWVPYDSRQNFLLDADVAVTTHFHHVETDFSFRTRVLDYFWASLPVVTTTGDAMADLVERRGLGIAVPPEDAEALEAALYRLLDDKVFAAECRQHVRETAPQLTWSVVLRPLVEFCRAPHRAADLRLGLGRADARSAHPIGATPGPSGLLYNLMLVPKHLRKGGLGLLVRKVVSRLRFTLG